MAERDRLSRLSPERRRLLERALAERVRAARGVARPVDGAEPAAAGERSPIPPRDPDAPLPLSFAQERFWFLDQLEPGSCEYNMTGAGRLRGVLDVDALARALDDLRARHATLRTVFPTVDGLARAELRAPRPRDLPVDDLSHVAPGARLDAARDAARAFGAQPFDLAAGPLFRARLLRLAVDEHVLLVGQHHAVSDGWSLGVMVHELAARYAVQRAGAPPPVQPPAVSYADWAAWQRARLSGPALDEPLAWWCERLRGATRLELPHDRPRPAVMTHAGASLRRRLAPDLSRDLRALARARGVTLFTAVLAGFAAWLARVSGEDDVVVGTAHANRDRAEVAGLLGPFVNTLALRLDLSGRPGFAGLLARVGEVSREAWQRAEVPFERLVDELRPERDPARQPLFDVFVDMAVPITPPDFPGLEYEVLDFERGSAAFDLSLSVEDDGELVGGVLEYNTDLLDERRVVRGWEQFACLLGAAVAAPDTPFDELPLHDARTRAACSERARGPRRAVSAGDLVHRLCVQAGTRAPNATALEQDGQAVSYAELLERSARLARFLRGAGVGPDALVGVCLPRSSEVLVTILAIWRAGGAYLPLDPRDPPERLAILLADAAPALVVTTSALERRLRDSGSAPRCVRLDADAAAIATTSAEPPGDRLHPDDLAYVIFTSGSTGRPKGVMVSHGNLANHLAWVADAFDITPADRFLLRTPFSFDASLWEIVHPLVSGAQLVVAPPDVQRDPRALLQLVAEARVTVLQSVPSMLRSWLDEPTLARCASLRHLVCAGETLTTELARRTLDVFARHGIDARLHNLYGPSEATIDASMHTCAPDDLAASARDVVPIGRPITNADVHVLDAHGEPVPAGVVGELHVGGAGVARGYLNRPGLSAARFRDDPFTPGGRLYATGDLGRWRADGLLEYVGRRDDQVKLRGHRVELGEVETALLGHADVREAAARVDERGGEARLVAWYVPREGAAPGHAELREHLAGQLPRHMLPEVFVALDALPRTPSEKLDRRALPAPPARRVPGDGRAPAGSAPRDAVERSLLGFVEELLELGDVGLDDDLFALGAHSLQATRLLARVAAAFGVELPLLTVFETPRVSALAAAVRAARASGAARALPPITPSSGDEPAPLTHAQQRLWFLQRLEPEATHYAMPGALRLRGALDADALARAWERLVQRHAALRTTFELRDGEPRQVVHMEGPRLRVLERPGLDEAGREAALTGQLRADAGRPFDPTREVLVRPSLLRFADDDHGLVVVQHHMISDAWSLGILARELGALYDAAVAAAPDRLPPLDVQPADVARWQAEHLGAESLRDELTWWQASLADAPSALALPADRPRPPQPSHRGAEVVHALSAELSGDLRRLARAHDTTLYVTLLTAFAMLLQRLSDQDEFVVGSTVAGRRPLQTEPLLGCFVNALPLRLDLSGAPSFGELLPRVRDVVREAFAREHVPFELLVDALGARRDPSRPPIFDVAFDVLHEGQPQLRLGALRGEPVAFEVGSSKLDLALAVDASREALRVHVEWDTALFDAETVDGWCRALHALLLEVVRDDATPLDRVPLLDDASAAAVVRASRTPAAPVDDDVRVSRRVAAHAASAPGSVALVSERETLDYATLDRRANRLARVLRGRGVRPGTRVALELGPTVERVVALLAVWRAGAAWTALQPGDPPERRAQLLQATRPVLVLRDRDAGGDADERDRGAHDRARDDTAPDDAPDVPGLDPRRDVPGDTPDHPLGLDAGPDEPAYVLCTSGTTGRPKAVVVPWRALDNHSAWFLQLFDLGLDDVMWQRLPPAFDAALLELLGPLLAGARMLLVPDAARSDPDALLELARRHGLSVLTALPTLQAALLGHPKLAECTRLHTTVAGGESMPPSLPARVAAHAARTGRPLRLVNLYGPTEATIDATAHVCDAAADRVAVPVGRAIAGARVLVVDAALRPVPDGVVGELVVGGAGVADGYLDDPDATARAFVPDPFDARPGARLYRTGDRARRRGDGALVFLGRRDEQVKLSGRRVELGEIEAALRALPGVRDAAVVVRRVAASDGTSAGTRSADGALGADTTGAAAGLLAAVVADDLTPAAARARLRRRLPRALVPDELLVLAELPRAPSGKLDTRALAELARAARAARAETGADGEARDAVPRSLVERDVVTLVAELLGRERVGAHDDLFALGANSLLAVRLVERVRERCGVSLPLRAVFEGPTPAELARAVAVLQRGEALARPAPLDLRALAALPDDVRPSGPTRPAPDGPRELLLTGATGFLGAFVLEQLLARTQARVHVLVRAPNEATAHARLAANLARYELALDLARVRVLPGELSAPRLGLAPDAWQALAARLDGILHGAAAVDFLASYARLAGPNVDGTLELLRLACAGGAVPVHLVSTLGVLDVPALHGRAGAPEDTPLDALAEVQGGYEQTKWVAEALVQAAGARGLPVAVHRPGRIAAHSRTGVGNPDDAAWRVLRGCVALGCYPALDVELDVTPVDFVAAALVELLRRGPAAGRTYHLVNPRPTRFDGLFAAARRRGHALRAVPLEEWSALLAGRVADDPRQPLFPLLPLLLPDAGLAAPQATRTDADAGRADTDAGGAPPAPRLDPERLVPDVRLPRPSCEHVLADLADTDVRCPPVGEAVLDAWLDALQRGGWLPAPGDPP